MLEIIEINSSTEINPQSFVFLEIDKITDGVPIFKKTNKKTGINYLVGEGKKNALMITISDEQQSIRAIQTKELEELSKSPEEKQKEMEMNGPDIKTPMVSGPSLDR